MSKNVKCEGPDLSYHNGAVNMKEIRDAGYQRIALRAGYGKNNTDEKFTTNALACHNLGVETMIYWFCYALNEKMAEAEGKYAVEHAKKYWKSCPIAFDFEYDSINYAKKNGIIITKKIASDYAVAFLKVVKEAGYIPVLYTNNDFLNRYFDMSYITERVGKVYIWYARYKNSLSAAEEAMADIWQYTSEGSIPGVSKKVDLNRYFVDFAN